ncbi:MAG: nucleotidyl transferase AbiEii/AbiGii toxin family protein, partial [Candidatus Obscuribacterales bacterium]|nr:nucleotidyl transferase AbiEii/AbiGii toxin family protein [Candidatus Obscuribacterales bacterium]
MNPAILSMLERYKCVTIQDYANALKEIMQEIALLGLWRSKFFEHAAFYGGTALRILYGLDRFSEDLDFSLLEPQSDFNLKTYIAAVESELISMGFRVTVEEREKNVSTAIESAFIKADTKEHLIKITVPETIADRVQKNKVMKVRFEVDTDPPGGFNTEVKILLQPIPFSVNT